MLVVSTTASFIIMNINSIIIRRITTIHYYKNTNKNKKRTIIYLSIYLSDLSLSHTHTHTDMYASAFYAPKLRISKFPKSRNLSLSLRTLSTY